MSSLLVPECRKDPLARSPRRKRPLKYSPPFIQRSSFEARHEPNPLRLVPEGVAFTNELSFCPIQLSEFPWGRHHKTLLRSKQMLRSWSRQLKITADGYVP